MFGFFFRVCGPHPVRDEDEDEGAVPASGPRPEKGVGPAGAWLRLCAAVSLQEEAQSLPARTGRCFFVASLKCVGIASWIYCKC